MGHVATPVDGSSWRKLAQPLVEQYRWLCWVRRMRRVEFARADMAVAVRIERVDIMVC